ncbi:hypothetical protein ACSJLL_25335, partial [Enterobacter kobei]
MSPALAGRFFIIDSDIPISLLLPATWEALKPYIGVYLRTLEDIFGKKMLFLSLSLLDVNEVAGNLCG